MVGGWRRGRPRVEGITKREEKRRSSRGEETRREEEEEAGGEERREEVKRREKRGRCGLDFATAKSDNRLLRELVAPSSCK